MSFQRLSHAVTAVGLGLAILSVAPVTEGLYGVTRPPGGRRSFVPRRASEGELVGPAEPWLDSVWTPPVFEGVGLDTLARGAGHVPGTALPGAEIENHAALIAISSGGRGTAVASLRLGDRVKMTTPFGSRRYRVVERRVLAPGDVRQASTRPPRVTLVTSYPADSVGPAPLRLCGLERWKTPKTHGVRIGSEGYRSRSPPPRSFSSANPFRL